MTTEAQFQNRNPIITDPAIVPLDKLEEALGRQIAENRIGEDRKKMNALRVYRQSEEIKEMQRKITAALVNKERSAQISEGQYRRQLDLVSHQKSQTLVISLGTRFIHR